MGLAGKELTRVNSIGKADLIRGIVPVRSNWNEKDVVGVIVVNYYVPYSMVAKMQEISALLPRVPAAQDPEEPDHHRLHPDPLPDHHGDRLPGGHGSASTWPAASPSRSRSWPRRPGRWRRGTSTCTWVRPGHDEIGMLITSFNRMTQDLRENQLALQTDQRGAAKEQPRARAAAPLHGDRARQRHRRHHLGRQGRALDHGEQVRREAPRSSTWTG